MTGESLQYFLKRAHHKEGSLAAYTWCALTDSEITRRPNSKSSSSHAASFDNPSDARLGYLKGLGIRSDLRE